MARPPLPRRAARLALCLPLLLAGCQGREAWHDIGAAHYAPDGERAQARPAFAPRPGSYAPPLPVLPPPGFMIVIP